MKILLTAALSVLIFYSSAQSGDFILLKKNDRTIQTYFPGSTISFISTTGAGIEAYIQSIRNDTLYLKQFVTRPVPTQLGVYVLDTSFYYYQYHYNQIRAIGKKGRRFDWAGSGAALMGGGILLTVASGVVYLADNNKFSPELLGAAVALTGVGYFLSRNSGGAMEIGKKYSLLYVKATEGNKPGG